MVGRKRVRQTGRHTPRHGVSQWLQFCLDEFETVDEAVKYFKANDVQNFRFGRSSSERQITVHLSLADRTGDSAVMQYIG